MVGATNSYDFANGSIYSGYRNDLFDPTKFGPGGTVSDVEFSSITRVSAITASELAGADIFVATFPYSPTINFSSSEAQVIKDFVDAGGSLIVVADGSNASLVRANTLGALFGGLTFAYGGPSGTISITDHTSAPLLTDGSFGTVSSVGWHNNAVAKISAAGDATMLDSIPALGVINPSGSSGSVIFYNDTASFSRMANYTTGDFLPLSLNMFEYSAKNSHASGAIPEPATFILISLSLTAVARRFRKQS